MVKIDGSSPATSPAEKKQPQTLDEFKEAARQVEGPYLHAVMISFRESASDEEVAQAVDELRSLGSLPGVLGLMVRESIDQRKGRTMLELGLYENGQAFLDWRDHPKHVAFAERLKEIADWVANDSKEDQEVIDFARNLGSVGVGGALTASLEPAPTVES